MSGSTYDVFLSYHWRDHAHVEAIARALRGHDQPTRPGRFPAQESMQR
jgi:hypothetical protein